MGWLMQVLSVTGAQKSASGSSCAVQRHGGDRSHGHRILTAHDSEFSLPPARALIEGSVRDPQPPPQSRLRARNLAAAWSLLAREVPRPTVASARRSEYDSAAAVVGADRTLTLNVEMASSKVKPGKKKRALWRTATPLLV